MIAPVAVVGILMLVVLAAMSSTNQALAAEKKRTELTISATPNGPSKTETNETDVTFSGRLTSEGSGVAGATIRICLSEQERCGVGSRVVDTDSGGHYSVDTELSDHVTHQIEASTVRIPGGGYEESKATTTIKLP